MKKKLPLIILLIFVVCIIFQSEIVTKNIQYAIQLWKNRIFPSLFPFMVLSSLLVNYGFLNLTNKFIGPLMKKLFNLSENTSYVFIMSLLSGFPSSSMYAKELYENNFMTKEETFQIVLFTHFSNPIFILSMVCSKPLLVLSIHYLTNIIIGILIRKKDHHNSKKMENEFVPDNFFVIFTKSIKNSIENLLFILGVIVFFFIISSIFNNPITNILLELSQGLNFINTNINNQKLVASLSAFLLSFGGFSVHMQTYGILSELNFPYFKYLKTRLFHALLSFVLVFILF